MRFKWSLLVTNVSMSIKEINTVLGKYTVPTIKLVLLLLQNTSEKISGCTGLCWLVLVGIGISAVTIKN